jgi:hypothetical protein
MTLRLGIRLPDRGAKRGASQGLVHFVKGRASFHLLPDRRRILLGERGADHDPPERVRGADVHAGL